MYLKEVLTQRFTRNTQPVSPLVSEQLTPKVTWVGPHEKPIFAKQTIL